jgi:hypothetical protein
MIDIGLYSMKSLQYGTDKLSNAIEYINDSIKDK